MNEDQTQIVSLHCGSSLNFWTEYEFKKQKKLLTWIWII